MDLHGLTDVTFGSNSSHQMVKAILHLILALMVLGLISVWKPS